MATTQRVRGKVSKAKPEVKKLPKGKSPSDVNQKTRSAANKLRNIERGLKQQLKATLKREGAHVTDYSAKLLNAKLENVAKAQAELDKMAA